jgi:hypothetical protein
MTLKFIIVGLRVNEDHVVGVDLKMSPQRELKMSLIYIRKSRAEREFPEGHRES